MQKWRYTLLCSVLFCMIPVVALAAGQDLQIPAGTLGAKQIKKLFAGRTVAANVVAGNKQELVAYFGRDGRVKLVKRGRQQKGKWKVRKDGRLCIKLKGAARDCRILVKKGNSYQQYAVKKDGQNRHELTYVKFRKGEHLAAMSEAPLLPQGTLEKRQVLMLFSGKTVESVTARRGRVSHSYYAEDGRVEQRRDGVSRYGKWRVTRQGRICLQMEDRAEKCRIIVRQDGVYKKYIVKKNGRHQHSVSYRKFRSGRRL